MPAPFVEREMEYIGLVPVSEAVAYHGERVLYSSDPRLHITSCARQEAGLHAVNPVQPGTCRLGSNKFIQHYRVRTSAGDNHRLCDWGQFPGSPSNGGVLNESAAGQ